MLDKKSEEFFAPRHFYVFVSLNEDNPPRYFIVPSKIVANYIKTHHQAWLKTKSKSGKKHKDSSLRKFRDLDEKYLDKWDLLKL